MAPHFLGKGHLQLKASKTTIPTNGKKAKGPVAPSAAWMKVQLARHPQRPFTLDYVRRIFTDFNEIHGDRAFGDDQAIVSGFAYLGEQPVFVIGQQKGRDTKEN